MSDTPYAAFGELLRQARKRSEYSQTGLSRKLGFSKDYYGMIERGQRQVSVLKLARMLEVLQFDANQLVDAVPADVEQPRQRTRREPVANQKEVASSGPYIAFGQLLASARRRLQVTQAELGRAMGYQTRMLSRLENGHHLPTLPRFAQLRRALGLDCNEMLQVVLNPGLRVQFYGFGRVIELARLAKSMSSEEVAGEIGCTLAYFQNIERGAVLPTMPVAIRIHQVVDFDVGAAFRWVWRRRVLDAGSECSESA